MQSALDAEMKGIGSCRKQAEIISKDEEELFWQKGLLGDSSPQALLDIIQYCSSPFAVALNTDNSITNQGH